jgi:hypothetical protein
MANVLFEIFSSPIFSSQKPDERLTCHKSSFKDFQKIILFVRPLLFLIKTEGRRTGLPDFSWLIYQSGEKLYQMTTKLTNANKIYPMVVKYSK